MAWICSGWFLVVLGLFLTKKKKNGTLLTIVRQKPLFHVRLGLNNHPDQLYYQKGAVLISQKAPNTE